MRIFKERQRFTQTWLIALMVISSMVPFFILIKEYVKENSSLSLSELLTALFVILLASGLIFLFRLDTRIDEKGIHYKFFPFHRKTRLIKWSEITSLEVRNYDPITEYGGWGLKAGWGRKNGDAINVSGTIGLQLILKNNKKLLIGTQRKDDIERVIATYKQNIKLHD